MALGVRATSSMSSNTGTAFAVTAPTGTTTGDVVFVIAHGNEQTTWTDNNGSTPFTEDLADYKPNASYGHVLSIFSRRIQSGDPTTYNFTKGSTGRGALIAYTVQDVNLTSIYDVAISTSGINSDGATMDAPSITTITDGALHICLAGIDDGTITVTGFPAGYGNTVAENDQAVGVASKIITTASATGAQTFTFSSFSGRVSASFAVKPQATVAVIRHLSLLGVGV